MTNQIISLSIASVAYGGNGVGRYDDQVVFVPYTVDGDETAVRILETHKRFARGELAELRRPSPHRETPRCAAYGRCGGCQYQHIRYEHQVALKTQQVRDALERLGRFATPPLEPCVASPRPYGYRGKADLHVAPSGKGDFLVGFAATASNRVVAVDRCELVDESINDKMSLLRQGQGGKGRKAVWSGPRGISPLPEVVRHVKGESLVVPENGFFQANLALTDSLVDTVLDFCALSGTETVLDGYCGAGLFARFLAPRCDRLYGIEANRDAVRFAERNMADAGQTRTSFHAGDMAEALGRYLIRKKRRVDVALVDPPRIGLGPETIDALRALAPERIVYVSCNPATLSRDLRAFAEAGYALARVRPLDMFPQTAHIETVALLLRSAAATPAV